ncbi:MAG: hypothetical protein ACJ795_08710 [Ktedonobacteraceae bacterium]
MNFSSHTMYSRGDALTVALTLAPALALARPSPLYFFNRIVALDSTLAVALALARTSPRPGPCSTPVVALALSAPLAPYIPLFPSSCMARFIRQ